MVQHRGLEDLEVYRRSREYRKKMYRLARSLPAVERFNLVSQIMRAATSLTNNVAEGYGRFHYQESIQFFRHSRGSLEELKDDIRICIDEGYIEADVARVLLLEAEQIEKLINGYIRYLATQKRRISGED